MQGPNAGNLLPLPCPLHWEGRELPIIRILGVGIVRSKSGCRCRGWAAHTTLARTPGLGLRQFERRSPGLKPLRPRARVGKAAINKFSAGFAL